MSPFEGGKNDKVVQGDDSLSVDLTQTFIIWLRIHQVHPLLPLLA